MSNNENIISQLNHSFIKHFSKKAIVINDIEYAYSEVYRYANRIYSNFSSKTEKPLLIGFFSTNSIISYATILASVLSGNTFVPLNKKNPKDRFSDILSQIIFDYIIVDPESLDLFESIIDLFSEKTAFIFPETSNTKFPITNGVTVFRNQFLKQPIKKIEIQKDNTDISTLYILFTSGSTGKSKGVELSFDNISAFINTNIPFYSLGENDRISQTFDLCFDLSMFCIFMSWCSGACLFTLNDNDLITPIAFINKYSLTLWFSVPYLINIAAISESRAETLKQSLFCGEALTIEHVKKWKNIAINSKIENLYGPTELTIACSRYLIDDDIVSHNDIVSIGKIYDNLTFIILNESNEECIKGELCVSGNQKFSQYINDFSTTQKAHINYNGFDYYRTGDIVSIEKNTNLIFHGRKDSQIKRNGYRIELGDIESQLKTNPCVDDAVCIAKNNHLATSTIIAYVKTNTKIGSTEILEHLNTRVANYMMVDHLVILEDFPRNSNGKIDKNILRSM